MTHLARAILETAGRVWRGDRDASDLAMQSEHRVARVRVLLIGLLTVLGLVVVWHDPANAEYRRAVPLNFTCLALALVVLHATRDRKSVV